ncbi:TetR family transcriptional regulator [Planosporangium flavigriseum]|uniref:TetR family transcriptional regulator n=1 Tax=Planosporangium flavigriseum TaxID=373681 RepID=A0A8J3LUY2_9ACTN|nr:TetR/AcrR family transcriptional regulator [Planosporangium flavigriseum]NJC65011.1 TetR family transcriptional regulator [Planosporangium flavigriseum]GIG71625.1 TetR family transcriptional regulator [Planosporangium flavigriseum]
MEAADAVDPAERKAVPARVPLGLRERKKLETFRALQSAARRLVGERGLANVTIEEIAEAANVSKRTFFNYFESKEAAVVDPEMGKVELLASELARRPLDETPLEGLWRATLVVLKEHAAGVQDTSALLAANQALVTRQAASYAKYHEVITEWAAARAGCEPGDLYPELLARVAGVMTHLSVTRWEPGSGVEGYIRLSDEIFRLLAAGLAAPQPPATS